MADVCPIEGERIRIPQERRDDPTELTTAALNREIDGINRELSIRQNIRETEHQTLKEILETKISALKELAEYRFDAQVVLLDERFTTSVKALDAAFAAAKLAVDTAQLAADKAVDRERETSNKRFDALDVKYSEIASRMDKTQGQNTGIDHAEVARRFNMAFSISVISVVIAIASILLAMAK